MSMRAPVPPSRRPAGQRSRPEHVAALLRPLLRAYLLAYASVVGPRLLAVVLQKWARARQRRADQAVHQKSDDPPHRMAVQNILRGGLEVQRFPTFCAVLVGGSTLLEVLLKQVLDRLTLNLSDVAKKRLSRGPASFVAAWLSLLLLQSKQSAFFTETVFDKADAADAGVPKRRTIHHAGRTLDLSLFAATRALDVIVGELWSRRKAHRLAVRKWTRADALVSRLTDSTMFALSTGLIMWAWIYEPARLPRAYNKWIGSAAAVDERLLEALRRCRRGELVYGKDTGQAPLLGQMCADYGLPVVWGDPAVTVPYPCDLVHMGCGPCCEYHAVSRFARSFRWAMATYLPLNLLLVLRSPSWRGVTRALLSAARSSAFLGALITLFYYGVCLARTRLGPHVLGTSRSARQHMDAGLCIGSGCFLCGWSILVETASRRKDMGLFVAPRALATLLPRRYALDKQWRETLVFALSTAIVVTCVRENKKRVRGVLGIVLDSVLNA